ncbi:diguanylate cyclase (GGDEF) domain-containing protein [Kushneria avicenniae]|uniref:diguanylate cyclase n=1 Tax=Kushneria avicenniae TaxID=402385 RepID=A0A1I1KWH5_9GAMM|nr:diguanylate cyclase [Kushneria avicenniae]SFC64642.1 diguanylate cyclase (GGDEF) domain-containing protein [Kushneria avicenniae]
MHSLRFRFLLSIVLVACLALLALWSMAHFVIYPDLLTREDDYVAREMGRVESAWQSDLNKLGAETRDWASWDDAYAFIQGRSPDFAESNFSQEMFEDMAHLMMVFMRMDGTPVWMAGYNPDTDTYSTCTSATNECRWMSPFFNVIQAHVQQQTPELDKWLLSVPAPTMIATSPIFPTERDKAPPLGWLAIVRSMDRSWFESIRHQTGVDVSIEPILHPDLIIKPPPIIRISDDQLLATRWLKAEPNDDVLSLQATLARHDFMANAASFNFAMFWTVGVLLTVVVVILGLLERIILAPTRRLARFTREQRQEEHFSEILPVSLIARRDELGSLAREFQHLLMHQKQRTDSLQQLSQRDHLTGLYNRRYLDDYLMQTLLEGHRTKTSSGLLIIDIDYFKAYNDHYGHLEGDHCLVRVAQSLQRALDDQGIMARVGGEEFIAVLPGVTREHLWRTAERLRGAVADLSLLHECSRVAPHITISLGMAMSIPEAPCQPAELIRLADESLYRAKQAGRNQVGARARDPQYHPDTL